MSADQRNLFDVQPRFDGETFSAERDHERCIDKHRRVRPTATAICEQCGEQFTRERYRILGGEGKYCSRACYDISRQNWTPEKFWANVRKEENGCWIWLGTPLQKWGYGRLRVNGKATRAHRHAYQLAYGDMPKGLMVCHTCDTRMCVNPDHLFAVTAHDNMRDMAAKGRAAGFKRQGEKHPLAKLTDAQVIEIRNRYSGRHGEATELAAEFGVSPASLLAAARGKTFRHL